MIKYYESVFYDTLEELNATYKHNHPDVLRLEKQYGNDVRFSRIMRPENIVPRFELYCYGKIREAGIMTKIEAVEENIIKATKEKDNVEKGVN